jgi:hypothetical protein
MQTVKSSDSFSTPVTVKDLIDERLRMREAQLKQEIDHDIEVRLQKGSLKLKERENRLISDSGLNGESLTSLLEAKDEKWESLNSLMDSLSVLVDTVVDPDETSQQEYPANDRCGLIFDELNRDLEEFKRIMRSESFSKLSQSATEHGSGTNNEAVEILGKLYSYLSSEISILYPKPVDKNSEIFTSTWSHLNSPAKSVSLNGVRDLASQIGLVEERISRLSVIPPQFSADEIARRIDGEYLSRIEHLTELILEKSFDTSQRTDYKFIAGICSLVIENNEEMLDNFVEAIDRFLELRVSSTGDKTASRYTQAILGKWMKRAKFFSTHSGSSVL